MSQCGNESVGQSSGDSVSENVGDCVSLDLGKSVDESVGESVGDCVGEYLGESVTKSTRSEGDKVTENLQNSCKYSKSAKTHWPVRSFWPWEATQILLYLACRELLRKYECYQNYVSDNNSTIS